MLTHRFAGPAIFAAVMLVMFQAVFVWAHPAMDAIQAALGVLGAGWKSTWPTGHFEACWLTAS